MADLETIKRELGRSMGYAAAVTLLPASPGLYALHGSADVWLELGLGTPPDARPLYVGKSESTLISRPLRQHFQHGDKVRETSLTGWSSPRRSLCAMLHNRLGLHAVPRNPANQESMTDMACHRTRTGITMSRR